MRTLVTGGAGFIGSTLVDRLLEDGHYVIVVDDLSSGSLANLDRATSFGPRLAVEQLDVRDASLIELVADVRPEVVVHLAAQVSVTRSVEDPHHDADVNLLGTIRLLEAARLGGVERVLFATSAAIYGDVPLGQLPIDESQPHRPTAPYGIAKAAAIDYLDAYGRLFGLSWWALALANVYGPRQNTEGEAGVVARFADNLRVGRPCTIFGEGDQRRDFVFVGDVADAFVRAATTPGSGVLNVGTGTATTVNELYQTLADCFGTTARAERAPARPGEIHDSWLDASRASQVLGWKATTSLADGLAAVVDSVRR